LLKSFLWIPRRTYGYCKLRDFPEKTIVKEFFGDPKEDLWVLQITGLFSRNNCERVVWVMGRNNYKRVFFIRVGGTVGHGRNNCKRVFLVPEGGDPTPNNC
jgi:hypothetical protein